MRNLLNQKLIIVGISLLIGIGVGWVLFHNEVKSKVTDENVIWTCSMDPQVRLHEPGQCPICGMNLIKAETPDDDETIFVMSEEAVKLSNIQTTKVSLSLPEKEISLQGKVKVDERRISNQTAHFMGRIEQLYISYTGESVHKGQKLASIYSPDLISAQKELFEAIKMKDTNPMIFEAAKNKLKLWKLSDETIDKIISEGKVQTEIDVKTHLTGVVLKKNVSVGDHVKEGAVLFEIADLTKVWVLFDAYESDLAWLKKGDQISFTVSAIPGVEFKEKITFIDPIVNSVTHTASVRIEMSNSKGLLKPEMFVNGLVSARLPFDEPKVVVPKSAVMWTGKRSVVYVKVQETEQPTFEFREVTLGLDLGSHYVIEEGLMVDEEIVTNGTFKLDAAAQLAGKKSMMNREPGKSKMKMNHMH